MRKFLVIDQEGESKEYGDIVRPVAERGSLDEIEFETKLLLLLSELAQSVEELKEKKDKQPVEALQILSDTVNRVAGFAEKSGGAGLEEGFLSGALMDASESFAHLKLLHVDRNRISAQTAINLYRGWTGARNDKNQAFQQISLGMVRVLESYLNSIAGFFHTPYMVLEWKDTVEIYINEVTESVKSITFS
ncbi:MAG: hypothetical protein ACHQ6U_00150 [Thermodesulfobacteriota bacterium]